MPFGRYRARLTIVFQPGDALGWFRVLSEAVLISKELPAIDGAIMRPPEDISVDRSELRKFASARHLRRAFLND